MSVHSGDWKLIRLFHQGGNGSHDYRLYNLADDLAEQHDLAHKHPEIVARLDAAIQRHIDDTAAVVPQPNPTFDPTSYHPEQIGVGRIRSKQASPGKAGRTKTTTRAYGWSGAGTCRLKETGTALVVISDGEDPYLFPTTLPTLTGGPFVVELEMKSNSSGTSSVYFNQPFAASRSVSFDALHDGQYHEYEIKLPSDTLSALRIDPSRGPGRIEIQSVHVRNQSGTVVWQWTVPSESSNELSTRSSQRIKP